MSTPPVLLITFNRPDLAMRIFERIRQARPERFFLAVDGPRADHPNDAERTAACRALAEHVDWPCEVQTLFHQANRGIKHGPIDAITWFFEHVESGIILEDDTLPDPSFFPFCAELLERYADDHRVAAISGFRPVLPNRPRHGAAASGLPSYLPAYQTSVWGWASWRKAWKDYDSELTRLDGWTESDYAKRFHGKEMVNHLMNQFKELDEGRLITWDYQWMLTNLRLNRLCLIPLTNLIANIGFGPEATHTVRVNETVVNLDVSPVRFPLRHPKSVASADSDLQKEIAEFFRVITQPQSESALRRILKLPNKVLQFVKRRLGLKK